MPKGRPKKVVEPKAVTEESLPKIGANSGAPITSIPEVPKVEPKPEQPKFKEAPQTPESVRIAESRKALEHPLEPGQQFFESPEGYVIVGDADKPHVFCRHANGGKGMLINPRR